MRIVVVVLVAVMFSGCMCGEQIPPPNPPDDAGIVEPIDAGACSSCATPINADLRCTAGVCGRGPCHEGFFDVDGLATFGCESICVARQCTFPDGGVLNVTHDPLPETNSVISAPAAGSSLGEGVQTNAEFTNFGIVGQGVPAASNVTPESSGGGYRHVGGFSAILK